MLRLYCQELVARISFVRTGCIAWQCSCHYDRRDFV